MQQRGRGEKTVKYKREGIRTKNEEAGRAERLQNRKEEENKAVNTKWRALEEKTEEAEGENAAE